MPIIDLNYILFISKNEMIIDSLKRICKRLGAQKIKHCERITQALAELTGQSRPTLIIEELEYINKEDFLTTQQETKVNNLIVPVPVFALVKQATRVNLQILEDSDYIGYETFPINETILEQKIRDIFHGSSTYDQTDYLSTVVEQHIANHEIKSAYKALLPALNSKPNYVDYLLHYASMLFLQNKFNHTERVLDFALSLEPDNVKAKNILTKTLLTTEKYQDKENLKT